MMSKFVSFSSETKPLNKIFDLQSKIEAARHCTLECFVRLESNSFALKVTILSQHVVSGIWSSLSKVVLFCVYMMMDKKQC